MVHLRRVWEGSLKLKAEAGETRRMEKGVKNWWKRSQRTETSFRKVVTRGWLLISACGAFVLISRYCTASPNCADTITQTLLLLCSRTSALAATERSLVSWWAEVWCMAPSSRGTAPASLNTRAQSSRWESAWCWESQRHWLTLSSACKQKNRWPRCQATFSSTGSRSSSWGHGRKTLCFFCQFYFALLPLNSNTSKLLWHLKFIVSTRLIIQVELGEMESWSLPSWCICEIQCALNQISPQLYELCSCTDNTLILEKKNWMLSE